MLFKVVSEQVQPRSPEGAEIRNHSTGSYMAVPDSGTEKLFSTMAAARDYNDKHTRQS